MGLLCRSSTVFLFPYKSIHSCLIRFAFILHECDVWCDVVWCVCVCVCVREKERGREKPQGPYFKNKFSFQ